ncbi:hypothetical protein U5N28_00280 [Lysinibacillus telephonicus]|uniref:Swarming motility protein SwrB n=1 Tax=Lysinibacillus telephonicus TaxID=1714840 RepID=A0A431UVY7_9BACI|nr:hypothetical protein [Lysinibacillus telephonicus]RTQ95234.1 hypothetical protein EKG35_03750 [Lysinibacillus telephonicus]
MVSVLIVILIVSQLICFYFILLLNTKLSKFKDLEIRQDKLIREMDDAISVYLLEMREENDRLIKELSNVKTAEVNKGAIDKKNEAMIETASSLIQKESNTEDFVIESKPVVPKNIVKNAYSQHKNINSASTLNVQKEPIEKTELPTFEQQVLKLHQQGKSIDEIAKITQKGKTEIELFIKFHA